MKRAVRRRMAAVRQALPAAARDLRSAHIVELVSSSPAFAAAQGVGLYAAMVERGEVDVSRLDALARKAGKRVYYPFMDKTAAGHTTGFRQVRDPASELQRRGHPFVEPDPSVPAAKAGDIDLIIVPALAAALTGHRIGTGSGFYDVTLRDFPNAVTCLVIFSFQLLAEVPNEPHDMPCSFVCTDNEWVQVR
jgi:5-formyltetrahydrofolate cyclo-ligase